jgi:polar amino acid transport system substrate-binding protein
MIGTRARVSLAALGAVAVTVLGAGCGSSNSSSSSSTGGGGGGKSTNLTATPGITQKVDKSIAAQVPSDVKSNGTLTVAADATYAPEEYIASDGHTVIGADPDMAKAIAEIMGLKADVKNVTFDSIIPGLAANRYDLGMSSFTVTKEREKTVDFVTYQTAGTSFYVKTQGGPDIQSLADLCGESVAAEKGTTQQNDATAQDKKCKAAGDSGVSVNVFPDQNGVNLALSSGRADVAMADSPVAAYAVEQSDGQFKLSGKPYGEAAYGIAMGKNSGLAKPVQAAVKAIIDNGAYAKILKYWGLDQAAISNPEINPTNVPAS